MTARPVVSYDDITLPYDQPEPSSTRVKPSGQPPSKKRKKNQKAKHWDHHGQSSSASGKLNFHHVAANNESSTHLSTRQDEPSLEGEGEGEGEWEAGDEEGEYEESRELTHDEIWDDSALVDAWESAMEEYRAYHGGEDAWKKEPVKKSPLWYNVPVDLSKNSSDSSLPNAPAIVVPTIPITTDDTETDSQPLNFDTFVPTHDASLDVSQSSQNPVTTNYIPDTPAGPMISQDEAFSRALSAMYWGGYWTAMYHAQRQMSQSTPASTSVAPAENTEADEDEDIEFDDEDEAEDYTPTQR